MKRLTRYFALPSWLILYVVCHLSSHLICLQHERQLDPTEITAIPIPLERLFVFVMAVAWIVVVTASSCSSLLKLANLVQSSAVIFLLMLLSGASLVENILHSLLSAVYLSALILWDLTCDNSAAHHNVLLMKDFLWRISPLVAAPTEPKGSIWIRAHGAVVVTIVFQIFLLYDRGWQVQRWPVPTILGSSIGWIAGSIVGSTPLGSLLLPRPTPSPVSEQELKTT